ncbi:MAG: DNA-packaging protein [Eubacteriales bacterium]|nr:DNA-packaging protein [Eubacteriales bacterium]
MVVNQKQLSRILGITDRRVRQLKESGVFENSSEGRGYELEKCVPEYIDYKVKAETGRSTNADIEEARLKHEDVKRKISELKLRRMRRELHEAADVEIFLSQMLSDFRNTLLSIPQRVSLELVGENDPLEISKVLEREMLLTLDTLSEYDPQRIDEGDVTDDYDDEDGEDDE